MSYKVIEHTNLPQVLPEHNNPPFSIPGVVMPHWEIHDNVVSETLHKKVYDYLNQCTWHQAWRSLPGELQRFTPGDGDSSWVGAGILSRTVGQPRTMFGSDEDSTRKRHPVIAELWDALNAHLGGEYEITGADEGMPWKDYPVPTPTDPNLKSGWRVYANGSRHDLINLQGYVHRDNPDLSDDTSVSMLWVSNPEWYPSWGGEIFLYPEDPDGSSGDHQQFNQGTMQQRRNFNIGWQDEGKTICLRPNRLIIFDGRTLHSTQPTRHRHDNIMNMRVVFRARKIKRG